MKGDRPGVTQLQSITLGGPYMEVNALACWGCKLGLVLSGLHHLVRQETCQRSAQGLENLLAPIDKDGLY